MKVGYILTTFPCRTETFAAREIEELYKLGFDITVLAAEDQHCARGCTQTTKVLYRPSLFSVNAVLSIGYLSVRYPLAFGKLVCLILKLIVSCPREALSLIGRLHTIGFFSRHLDHEAISHIHAYFLSWPASIGLALAIATGRTLSISAHARDIFVERGAAELKASRAKFITACTQQGLKHLKANLPVKYHHKLNLTYHGTRIAFGCPDLRKRNIADSKPNDTVIAVGRLIQKKGFEGLVRAFALVVRRKPHTMLMIAGDGPGQKRLNGLIEQLALEDHAELLGWQEPDVTLRLIEQATMLVAPSVIADDGDRDGIPNVVLEAFASGTPVIASNLEGISEVVEHRKTGLLVKPGDVRELASAIEELLNNKDLQSHLSQAAYEMTVQRFDSTKNTKQLAKLFIGTN
ncbi:MAG: glycosyltransferase family 4 protein [Desulfobacteraceae bacterium]|nr:glycosyltransferase family 4 protein [Desulfobacteraceae bacterium]